MITNARLQERNLIFKLLAEGKNIEEIIRITACSRSQTKEYARRFRSRINKWGPESISKDGSLINVPSLGKLLKPQGKLIPKLTPEEIDALNSNIDKRGIDECWPWIGSLFPARIGKKKRKAYGGYPRYHLRGETWRPTRIVLFLSSGEQYSDRLACHICDNIICCNPKHLFWGTDQDNMDDCVAKGRTAKGDESAFRKYPEARLLGEKNKFSKLTDKQVSDILLAGGDLVGCNRVSRSQLHHLQENCEAARGICIEHLCKIIRRKERSHVPIPAAVFNAEKAVYDMSLVVSGIQVGAEWAIRFWLKHRFELTGFGAFVL